MNADAYTIRKVRKALVAAQARAKEVLHSESPPKDAFGVWYDITDALTDLDVFVIGKENVAERSSG